MTDALIFQAIPWPLEIFSCSSYGRNKEKSFLKILQVSNWTMHIGCYLNTTVSAIAHDDCIFWEQYTDSTARKSDLTDSFGLWMWNIQRKNKELEQLDAWLSSLSVGSDEQPMLAAVGTFLFLMCEFMIDADQHFQRCTFTKMSWYSLVMYVYVVFADRWTDTDMPV